MCHLAALVLASTVDGPYTSLENWKSKICSTFEHTFLLKNLPVTHVRQATIFAGQTLKFYRSVTGTYFEACHYHGITHIENKETSDGEIIV
jgi:hypothetical protein